jgi:hypothetical protein
LYDVERADESQQISSPREARERCVEEVNVAGNHPSRGDTLCEAMKRLVLCLVALWSSAAPAPALADERSLLAPAAEPETQGRVEVAGASGAESVAAHELTLTSDTPALEYRLSVAEVGRKPVAEVALAVEPLVDEHGAQHAVEWGIAGADKAAKKSQDYAVIAKPLAALARVSVVLTATLPEPGSYSTSITPYWDGERHQKVVLKVVRRRAPLNLAFGEASPFAQDLWSGPAIFWLSLQETEGKALSLAVPELSSLIEARGTETKTVAVTPAAKLVLGDANAPSDAKTIELAPGQSRNVSFRLEPLPGPGKYDAKVRFAAADALPVEKAVTLYLRHPWWLAAGLIAVGVLASWLLKYWVSQEQPRLRLLEQASRLAPELDAALRPSDLDADERQLGEATRERLARLLSSISQGAAGTDVAAVNLMALRISVVRNWIIMHRSVRQVSSDVVRQQFFGELEPIRDDLGGDGIDDAGLRTHETTLRTMPSRLKAAVRKQSLAIQLEQMMKELSDPNKEAALRSDVQALLDKGDLEAAAARMQREQEDILLSRAKKVAATGGPMGSAQTASLRAALANPYAGFSTPVLDQALSLTFERLRRGLATEIVVNAIIAGIAVLLGMKALYLDDLAWGGFGAGITAFVWGLGLHQFTYGGVGSVLDKLAKPGGAG